MGDNIKILDRQARLTPHSLLLNCNSLPEIHCIQSVAPAALAFFHRSLKNGQLPQTRASLGTKPARPP